MQRNDNKQTRLNCLLDRDRVRHEHSAAKNSHEQTVTQGP